MMKNKKGFTLIELLAVIVVLIIIIFVAVNKVNESTRRAKSNTIRANAIAYIKAVNSFIGEDSLSSERMEEGIFDLAALDELGVKVSGTQPSNAYVGVFRYKIVSACIGFNNKKVLLTSDKYSEPQNGTCDRTDVNIFFDGDFDEEIVFAYTGGVQTFTAPVSGFYKFELWGAQGGDNGTVAGGNGAYTSGVLQLQQDQVLYVYVGGKANSFNGGGTGAQSAYKTGGGATDIRLVDGNWNNFESLKSRIMVAAGGGGAGSSVIGGAGGTLTGEDGGYTVNSYHAGKGGTQTSGGAGGTGAHTNGAAGSFGTGANGTNYSAGGGGGYYGGGSSGVNNSSNGSGGGGSSFISGYNGCDALDESSTAASIVHTGNPLHYSLMLFYTPDMKSGKDTMPTHDGSSTMTGNSGDGYVRITY